MWGWKWTIGTLVGITLVGVGAKQHTTGLAVLGGAVAAVCALVASLAEWMHAESPLVRLWARIFWVWAAAMAILYEIRSCGKLD
jgi:hypothetical protein